MAKSANNGAARRGTDLEDSQAVDGGPRTPGPLARALRIPLRRWRLSVAFVLLSAVTALLAGYAFRQKTYNAECILVYTPPPQSEFLKAVYTPAKVETLETLIDSQDNLMALKQEYDLALTTEVLKKKIKVTPAVRTESVTITLAWGDPVVGAAMLNRLAELHVQQVRRIRQAKTEENIEGVRATLRPCQEELRATQEEYDRYRKDNNILDAKTERDKLDKDLEALDAKILDARRNSQAAELEIRRLNRLLEELDVKLAWSTERQRKELDAEGDRAYTDLKRNTERALLAEKTSLAEAESKFRSKREEYTTVEDLLRRKAISQAEFSKIEGEYRTLLAEVNNRTTTVNKLEEDLRELPGQYLRSKRPELAEKLVAAREVVKTYGEDAARYEGAKRGLQDGWRERVAVLAQAEELEKKLKKAESQKVQYEGQLAALQQLQVSDLSEVRVTVPAVPPPDAAASSFKKVAGLTFVALLMLLFGAMLVTDKVANSATAGNVAERLGLPALATLSPAGPGVPGSGPRARALALRLRQSLPESGGLLLCSPLNDDEAAEGLAFEVGLCLALQGERVLLLDARIGRAAKALPAWVDRAVLVGGRTIPDLTELERAETAAAGLVQYLVFEGQDAGQFVRPTRVPGLDYLPAGGPCQLTDVLASQPMRDLLEGLQRGYSLVVVLGPALGQAVDTEILAGYVNGVLALVNPPAASCTPEVEAFVQSLKEANAPLLGSVLCG
jgi:uncharacterized protein involved in exopolysaccharide biosynthesis